MRYGCFYKSGVPSKRFGAQRGVGLIEGRFTVDPLLFCMAVSINWGSM